MNHYPHKLLIFRGTESPGGNQDDDGVWVDDTGLADVEEIYNDRADVQDGGKELQRDNLGSPDVTSDAVAFLRDESTLKNIRPGDQAEITWEDGTTDLADVSKIRRLDGTVFLKRL